MGLFDKLTKGAGDLFGSIFGIRPAKETNPFAGQAAGMADQFVQMGMPVQREINQQLTEALRTGGIQAQMPMITRMMDNMRLSSGKAMRATTMGLQGRRLLGTPFGENILAQQRMESENAIGQIGPQMAQWFIQQFGGNPMGQMQMGANAAVGAAGAQAPVMSSQNQAYASLLGDFMKLAMGAAKAGGGATAGQTGG